MGETVQTRQLGGQLSEKRPDPRPIAIPIAGGELVTGIEWRISDAAILFLHDSDDELGLDTWRAWPDRFAELGYYVVVVDLLPDRPQESVTAALGYLAAQEASRRFIVAAGNAAQFLEEKSADAFVLVGPRVGNSDPITLGITPKLILAGTDDPVIYGAVERFARGCRGWSLLSTFVTDNSVDALLEGRHALQVGSQIASFLQEYRGTP